MRAVIYCRVNTKADNFESNATMDKRLTACREYAAQHDMEIIEEYREYGVSGSKSLRRRVGLKYIKALAEKGKIDVVLAKDISNISRRTDVFFDFCRAIGKCGVKLITVSDGEIQIDVMERMLVL